ncbi:hypothetical protein [Streptomyces sp. NBC_00154]|uniref:hypothetical protein n=1 Tax=Streptomyces sp. NBC_00154 TaxID=2975670 RepID=UPI0022551F60|nr:hypothetical protein [Streptomyces sp. NBC_00154]MCX5316843.1 hypothetical protein [Streptomyces sp. NBC_00154]
MVIVATREVFDTGGQLDRGVSGLDGGLGEGVGDEAVGMAGFDRRRWASTVFGLRKRVLVAVGHPART